jgi:hypothetical protein
MRYGINITMIIKQYYDQSYGIIKNVSINVWYYHLIFPLLNLLLKIIKSLIQI